MSCVFCRQLGFCGHLKIQIGNTSFKILKIFFIWGVPIDPLLFKTSILVIFYLFCSCAVADMFRGERIVFSGPNTNTNIIRVHKFDRIRIRILFVFFIMTEYEYEYYSGSEIWPNTNTNIIRSATFDRIRIRILRLFE